MQAAGAMVRGRGSPGWLRAFCGFPVALAPAGWSGYNYFRLTGEETTADHQGGQQEAKGTGTETSNSQGQTQAGV